MRNDKKPTAIRRLLNYLTRPTASSLEEIYAIREQLLANAGGDIQKYLKGVRHREDTSGRLLGQGVRETPATISGLTPGCSGESDCEESRCKVVKDKAFGSA